MRPGRAISIYGNVDLEVDFAPVKGSADDIANAQQVAQDSGSAKDKAAAAVKIAAAEAADAKAALAAAARAKAALLESKPGVNVAAVNSPSRAQHSATAYPSKASPASSPSAKPGLISQLVAKSSPIRSPGRGKPDSSRAIEPASPDVFSLPMVAFSDIAGGSIASMPPTLASFAQSSSDMPTTEVPVQSVAKPNAKALAEMREERARAAAARLSQQQANPPQTEPPSLRTSEAEGWQSSAISSRSLSSANQVNSSRAPNTAALLPQRANASSWASKEGDAGEGKIDTMPSIAAPSPAELEDDGISSTRRCPHCMQVVPRASFEMHSLRCARSAAYHKTACAECGQQLFVKDAQRHVHCVLGCGAILDVGGVSEMGAAAESLASLLQAAAALHAQVCQLRTVSCECGVSCTASSLEAHRLECPFAKSACRFCRVTHKKMALAAHEERCGSRTQACEDCGALIVLRGMAEHLSGGACPGPTKVASVIPPPLPPALPEQSHNGGKEDDRDDSKKGDGRKPGSSKAFSRLSAAVAAGASGAGSSVGIAQDKATTAADEAPESNGVRSSVVPWGGAAPASPSKRGDAAITAAAESVAAAKTISGAVKAEKAKVVVKGAAPSRPSVAAPRRELLQCPHCNKGQSDFEALQMHVFTACTKAPADGGAGVSGARASVPRARGVAAPPKR